jgi:hypothetical protein
MAPYLGSPDENVNGEKLRLREIECSGSPYEVSLLIKLKACAD